MSLPPFLNLTDLFESGKNGYERYRIPGVAVTAKGTVIATCDARRDPNLGDWSDIDLFIRRSPDLGKTWGAPVKLIHRGLHHDLTIAANPAAAEQGLGAKDQYPFNNQTLVVDGRTGAILFVYCLNYARCFVRRSLDEGVTWSAPAEITTALAELKTRYPWKVIGTGPNHGIQLRNGRMIIPVWLSRGGGDHGHRPSVVSTVFSDDGGQSWSAGEIAAEEKDPLVNPNETVAVELADGSVMLNMRSESLQHRRGVAYSPDGATQWTRPEFVNDLADPVCMAGITRLSSVESHGRSRLLFSHCDNCAEPRLGHASRFYVRKNLTIRVSYDEGRTWPVGRVLEPALAGYSDIHSGPDGSLFCIFERGSTDGSGEANNNRFITLAHFNLEWVTSGKDSLELP